MSRLHLAARLAVGDLRRSPVVAALLVVVIGAVTGAALVAMLVSIPHPATASAAGAVAAGLVLVVTRLALAVQERQRTRTGALLALNGARRSDAALARAAAVALLLPPAGAAGLGVLVATARVLDQRLTGAIQLHYELSFLMSYVAVAFAVALGALVAAMPGRRDDALRADLAGRRPSRPVGTLHLIGAVALMIVGLAALRSILSGWQFVGVLALGTAAFLASACLLRLCEPLGRRLGVAGQLAGWSLNRHRYRTVPLAGLVAVGLAIGVVAATARATNDRHLRTAQEALAPYRRTLAPADHVVLSREWAWTSGLISPAITERVLAELPGAQATTIPLVSGPGLATTIQSWHPATGIAGSDAMAGLATAEVLAAFGLSHHQSDVEAGRALVLNPLAATREADRLRVGIDLDGTAVVLDAVDVSTGELVETLPGVLLPPAFGEQHPPHAVGEAVLIRPLVPIDDATRRRLDAITLPEVTRPVSDGGYLGIWPRPGSRLVFERADTDPWPPVDPRLGGTVVGDTVLGEAPHANLSLPGPVPDHPVLYARRHGTEMSPEAARVLLTLALVVAAIISLTAVGLGLSQGRHDEVLLALQGAAPSLRRRILALEAGGVVLVGAILAATTGPLVCWAYLQSIQQEAAYPRVPPVAVPWTVLGLLVFALPVVLGLIAFVVTPPLRRLDVGRHVDDT